MLGKRQQDGGGERWYWNMRGDVEVQEEEKGRRKTEKDVKRNKL